MKALVTTATGPLGVKLTDVQEPEPHPDQVLVEVHAVAVNRGDLTLAAVLPAGSRIGLDIAGVVTRCAADGTGPPVGTRVVGFADRDGWAERVAIQINRITPLPDDAADTAAALPVAGLTALYALRRVGWLLGRTVLITGAGGGVGRMAVQLASAAGARVIAWVGSAERMTGLAELGADVVTTYDEANPEPVEALIDAAGGDVLSKAFAHLVPGGTLVSYGNTARSELVLPVDWGHARPGIKLSYLSLFDEVTRRPAGRDLSFLVRLMSEGRLDPQVTMTMTWTAAAEALKALQDRQVNGKVVLTLPR